MAVAELGSLDHIERMTSIERQKWESVRAKGHTRFILHSFLQWGVWMCVVQLVGTFLFDVVTHKSFALYPIFPWPVVNFVFFAVFWIFGFGYVMGEMIWQKQERDYQKDDHVV